MENYNIRKIESRDDNAILNIVRSCFEEFGAPLPGSVYCDPRLEHLSNEFEGENAEYWVIEDEDKKVIGGAGFFLGLRNQVEKWLALSSYPLIYRMSILPLIKTSKKKFYEENIFCWFHSWWQKFGRPLQKNH